MTRLHQLLSLVLDDRNTERVRRNHHECIRELQLLAHGVHDDVVTITETISSGFALTDGDYGDIVVGGTGTAITIDSDAVTDAKLRDSAALSVIGRSANTSGNPADIAASTDGDVLRRSGTTLGFGTIPSSSVTGLGAIDFGDGSDGVCAFDGAATILGLAPVSSVYTLTRDIFLADGSSVSTGVTITGPYIVHCNGTLTLTGTAKIANNGATGGAGPNDSVGAGVGAAGVTAGSIPGSRGGATGNGGIGISASPCPRGFTAGSAAGITGPTPGNPGSPGNNGSPGQGGSGGSGGAAAVGTNGGTSGPSGTVTLDVAANGDIRIPRVCTHGRNLAGTQFQSGSGGGGGGAGGIPGGGGGGGGAGGGWTVVAARIISGSGSIEAKGGTGGAGGNGTTGNNCGAGGGGGGGGGVAVVLIGSGSFPTVTVTGGTGGAAGTEIGTGFGGAVGGNGGAGISIQMRSSG